MPKGFGGCLARRHGRCGAAAHGGARHAVMVRVMVGPVRPPAPIGHAIGPVIVRVPRPKPLRPFVSRFAPWGIKVTILLPAAAAPRVLHRCGSASALLPWMPPQRRFRRRRLGIDRAEVVPRRGIRRSTAALPAAH